MSIRGPGEVVAATGNLEEDLQQLEIKLATLRREYDQYFLGTRPREPAMLRGEVQKLVVVLTNQPIQNTALRFKFGSLCSRFQAFRRQWDETLRKIEAGTYERHRFKAAIHGHGAPRSGGAGAPPPRSGEGDLFQELRDARMACGQDVRGLTKEKLNSLVERQQRELRERFGDDARFRLRVAVENGKAKLKATRVGG